MLLIFSGQLDVTQNDFRKRVDRTHQQWIAPFARGVQVTDVSAADLHVLGDVGGAPLMSKGKVYDESHAQQRDFPRTDLNIVPRQLRNHLLFVTMPEEKGFARIDHHVVAEVGTGRHQSAQFLAALSVAARLAGQEHFARPEGANMQCTDRPSPCFLYIQIASAVGALRNRGSERHQRWFAEQTGYRHPVEQPGKIV